MINFGAGRIFGVPTTDAAGNAIAVPTPVEVAVLQDVSVDMSADLKTLYGNKQYPVAVGRGKGKIEIAAKYADVSAAALGSLYFGKSSADGIKDVHEATGTIPTGSPYEITAAPPASGTFVADLGVFDATTGAQFTRVALAATPLAGQYKLDDSTGTYTFAAADANTAIKYYYEYSASTGGQVFNLTNELMGYAPSFQIVLANTFDGKKIALKFNRAISSKLTLPMKNEDFTISDFSAEAFADAAGNIGWLCLA